MTHGVIISVVDRCEDRWSGQSLPSQTSVLEDLHWLPVSQRASSLQDGLDGLEVCSWCCSSLSLRPLRTRYYHLRSSASAIRSDWHSTGSTRPDCYWTTVTGPVGERLQAGTEEAPVLTVRHY